jgi:predicted transglutaminase-like cysteine proteinase
MAMKNMLRRASAVMLFGLIGLGPLGAEADTGVYYPSFKTISSTKWDVKTPVVKNWREMLTRWADGKDCDSDTCSSSGWPALVAQVEAAGDVQAQAKLANSLVNAHPYVEDMANWKVQDYWETPYEFLKKSGDAEDFAITKYFLLKAAGVPVDNMQIVAVRLKSLSGVGHAILLVRYGSGHTLVLDNRAVLVMDVNAVVTEYQPVLGVNDNRWTLYMP